MITAYKSQPTLTIGELIFLDELAPHLLCFWRKTEQSQFLALHNLSDEVTEIVLPLGGIS